MLPLYRFVRGLMAIILKLTGTTYVGQENIPADKAVIFAANHSSFGDPILLACSLPFQVHFLAKAEFADNSFVRWLFTRFGIVFLKRNDADLGAIKAALGILKTEKPLAMFPEGHRNTHALGEFKQGATFIAYRAKVKIVPVAIIGARSWTNPFRRNKKVIIGPPILIEKGSMETAEALTYYTNLLKEQISKMLEDDLLPLKSEELK